MQGFLKRGRPKGYKMSDESKAKISKTQTGHVVSKSTKSKIAKKLKKYFLTPSGKDQIRRGKDQIRGTSRPIGSTIILARYRWIKTKDGWLTEHRHKVECLIGRKLTSEEIVHHKDENKLNNFIWNLQIVSKEEHRLIHNCKFWEITTPDKKTLKIFNLADFCRKNELCYSSMRNVARGRTVSGLHRNYSCKFL